MNDEIWKFTYQNGLVTNYGHDVDADGELEWREQYTYTSANLLLKILEDDGGDGAWDNTWQYSYTNNFIDVITYDIGQDSEIEETWTTQWNCP